MAHGSVAAASLTDGAHEGGSAFRVGIGPTCAPVGQAVLLAAGYAACVA